MSDETSPGADPISQRAHDDTVRQFAPEMLALLREPMKATCMGRVMNDPCGACWDCRRDALLARIDGKA